MSALSFVPEDGSWDIWVGPIARRMTVTQAERLVETLQSAITDARANNAEKDL